MKTYGSFSVVCVLLIIILFFYFDDAYAVVNSPLKQFRSGIIPNDIMCNDGLNLVIKDHGFDFPACVHEATKLRLIQRGWAQNIPDGTTLDLVCGSDFLQWDSGRLVNTTGFVTVIPIGTQNTIEDKTEKSNEPKPNQFVLLPNSSGKITMMYDVPCGTDGFEITPPLDVLYNFFNYVNSENVGLQQFGRMNTVLTHITSQKSTNLHVYVSNIVQFQNNSVSVQYSITSLSEEGRYLFFAYNTCPGDLLTIGTKPYAGDFPYFNGPFYGCKK